MQLHQDFRRTLLLSGSIILLSLACSPFALSQNNQFPTTRTPLPTFTPTLPADAFVEVQPTPNQVATIPPTSEAEPTLPSTNTPLPEGVVESEETILVEEGLEEEEVQVANEDEAKPEEIVNEGQAETEVDEAAPPPAEPPPATEPDPPDEAPAEPAAGAHGVIGKISFREGRNTYGVGERVFVKIEATNTQPGQLSFGILGLTTSTGTFQTSWSSGTIDGTFTHEDGIAFSGPGNHKIWLSICFSSEQDCQGANGDWERFEPGLDVVIQ